MNTVHRYYCRSPLWSRHVGTLLPWALKGIPLQDADVLELGSGPGLTTNWLAARSRTLSALEYDASDSEALARRRPDVTVVQGDASAMPFEAASFDVVVCFTMLHHLQAAALQDRLFVEARRVLRPAGVFAGSDSRWGPLFALAHVADAMTLVDPHRLPTRLRAAGFAGASQNAKRGVFRFRADV